MAGPRISLSVTTPEEEMACGLRTHKHVYTITSLWFLWKPVDHVSLLTSACRDYSVYLSRSLLALRISSPRLPCILAVAKETLLNSTVILWCADGVAETSHGTFLQG